jgi:hypothetical protein
VELPRLNHDGPDGNCSDIVSRRGCLRTSADASKVGIWRRTAKMMEHCLKGTFVPEIGSIEMSEEGNLRLPMVY